MLKQRIITALVLAPLALAGIFYLPYAQFQWFVGAIIVLAAWEWGNFCNLKPAAGPCLYAAAMGALIPLVVWLEQLCPGGLLWLAAAFWVLAMVWVLGYPASAASWGSRPVRGLIGCLVLLPTWQALITLKQLSPSGAWILLLLLIVWAADIGAYFAGRRWGRAKLAPAVSPGKTRAGLYGGLASSMLVILAFAFYQQASLAGLGLLLLIGLVTAFASVLGDLFESMLKRHRGIKDSSQLLPGHGGVMDRIDSLTAAAPVFALGMSLGTSVSAAGLL